MKMCQIGILYFVLEFFEIFKMFTMLKLSLTQNKKIW